MVLASQLAKNIDDLFVNYEIKNIVVLGIIHRKMDGDLDLLKIKEKMNARSIEKFGSVEFKHDSSSFTIFRNNKIILNGVKEESEIPKKLEWLKNTLNKLGWGITSITYSIVNMTATTELEKEDEDVVNLDGLSMFLKNCIYDPQHFPALMYRPEGNEVMLIFSNGKVNGVGFKSIERVEYLFSKLMTTIRKFPYALTKNSFDDIDLNLL